MDNIKMEEAISKKEFKGFSGNELKVFAIIAMVMDHLAFTIWPGYHKDWWLLAIHLFGRLAAHGNVGTIIGG